MNNSLSLAVPTLLGTESIVANEIRSFGWETTEVTDGRVTFRGDFDTLCRANINLRSAGRVMIKIAEFKALSFEELFEEIKKINWEDYIVKDGAFPVNGYSLKSALHSVPNCQSIIKKAIVTRLSQVYKINWFEESGAVYPIRFSIMKDVVSVFIDTTGDNLCKRGYRQKSVDASLRETIASGMIFLSRWQGDRMFADPFCGSGTIAIEAAMYAMKIAPGLKRNFAAEKWQNLISKDIWNNAKSEAEEAIDYSIKPEIYASDISDEAIRIAKINAKSAGVADKIHFSVCDVNDLAPSDEKGVIICNPPYGERLMNESKVKSLYRDMGRKFSEFKNAKKYILTSFDEFEKYYGKKADKKRKIYNGMIKCDIYQYYKI
ncbi:MAG: class I SAM-dependent RNA methyltransferase [Clostridia bacterium]|nr:class I SAM-dependent RNA methyltransferase [Clostridia bacterium]